jgi:hypothetical protein
MAIRRRAWASNGVRKEAWVVDFKDPDGRRRLRTFKTKKEADLFEGRAAAIRSGIVPTPGQWASPVQFTVKLPDGHFRNGPNRETLASSLRTACPMPEPTTNNVILHVLAEMSPRSVIADVDNLLKPVLDALKGIAWLDDTQVCELLVRRVPSSARQFRIKLWSIPGPLLNTWIDAGYVGG